MSGDIVVLIFVSSMLLGLVVSKSRNPLAIVGCGFIFVLTLCIIWLLVVVCQDMWIFHNWLQTVK